jgi:hypothetical protein
VDTGLFVFEDSTMGKTKRAYPPESLSRNASGDLKPGNSIDSEHSLIPGASDVDPETRAEHDRDDLRSQ